MSFIYQWIDLLWLPIVFVAVHRRHWGWALGFMVSCILMLRLQTELMDSVGAPTGLLPLMDSPVLTRGLVVYSVIYLFYFALAWFSPGSRHAVFMAASISIFFFALTVSMIVMVL